MAASIDRPAASMRVALVCLSNVNRSMEAHHLFARHHYAPRSFGTGAWIRPTVGASEVARCFWARRTCDLPLSNMR
jgi:hypothetical protein